MVYERNVTGRVFLCWIPSCDTCRQVLWNYWKAHSFLRLTSWKSSPDLSLIFTHRFCMHVLLYQYYPLQLPSREMQAYAHLQYLLSSLLTFVLLSSTGFASPRRSDVWLGSLVAVVLFMLHLQFPFLSLSDQNWYNNEEGLYCSTWRHCCHPISYAVQDCGIILLRAHSGLWSLRYENTVCFFFKPLYTIKPQVVQWAPGYVMMLLTPESYSSSLVLNLVSVVL